MNRSMFILGLLFLLLPVLSSAAEPLDKGERMANLAFYSLLLVDWKQTRYIADNPDRYTESNPILGSHPSRSEVDRHFAISLIAVEITTRLMPRLIRRTFQYSLIALEIGVVKNNYEAGIRIDF